MATAVKEKKPEVVLKRDMTIDEIFRYKGLKEPEDDFVEFIACNYRETVITEGEAKGEIKKEAYGIENVPIRDTIVLDGATIPIVYTKGMVTHIDDDGNISQIPNFKVSIDILEGKIQFNWRTDPDKYKYLMICNYNRSNPTRLPDKAELFYSVDEDGERTKEVASRKTKSRAESYIWDLRDDQLSAICHKLGLRVHKNKDYLKSDIIDNYLTDKRHEAANLGSNKMHYQTVIDLVGSIKFDKFCEVVYAEKAKKIRFNTGNSTWYFINREGAKTEAIVNVEFGEDRHLSLATHYLLNANAYDAFLMSTGKARAEVDNKRMEKIEDVSEFVRTNIENKKLDIAGGWAIMRGDTTDKADYKVVKFHHALKDTEKKITAVVDHLISNPNKLAELQTY